MKWIFAFILVSFVSVNRTAAAAAEDEYERILLTVHAGGHGAHSVSLDIKKRLLQNPALQLLLRRYSQSLRETTGSSRPSDSTIVKLNRMYQDHLVEIALRIERSELNLLVRSTFLPSANAINQMDEEKVHMQILGKIFASHHRESFAGYQKDDYEKAKTHGALALYVMTEALMRVTFADLTGLGPEVPKLLKIFGLSSAGIDVVSQMSIKSIENVARTGLAELVKEYKNIFESDECQDLLTARHPRRES